MMFMCKPPIIYPFLIGKGVLSAEEERKLLQAYNEELEKRAAEEDRSFRIAFIAHATIIIIFVGSAIWALTTLR